MRAALSDAQINAIFDLQRMQRRDGRDDDLVAIGAAAIGALIGSFIVVAKFRPPHSIRGGHHDAFPGRHGTLGLHLRCQLRYLHRHQHRRQRSGDAARCDCSGKRDRQRRYHRVRSRVQGTILLTTGQIKIGTTLTIASPGADKLTIDRLVDFVLCQANMQLKQL
jgi:hypothetical protein